MLVEIQLILFLRALNTLLLISVVSYVEKIFPCMYKYFPQQRWECLGTWNGAGNKFLHPLGCDFFCLGIIYCILSFFIVIIDHTQS